MNLERPIAPDPYDYLPSLPALRVASTDLVAGAAIGKKHIHGSAGGQNVSPNLSWTGAPAGTASFAITCFDPDAPTVSGWWHWLVTDLPAGLSELATGAAAPDAALPAAAVEYRNDFGEMGYGGAAPPPGDHPHRYMFAVHALDVPALQLPPNTPAAIVGFHLVAHGLARGVLTVTYAH